jgi:hypothetical protein
MGSMTTDLYENRIGAVRVIGWRANLQSTPGISNLERRALGEHLLAVVGSRIR